MGMGASFLGVDAQISHLIQLNGFDWLESAHNADDCDSVTSETCCDRRFSRCA
jgi:hypothetical protein